MTARKKPSLHGTHPEVSQLINDAQETAVRQLVAAGLAADTPDNRDELARLVRVAILRQVAVGQWARHGAREYDDIADLQVGTTQGNELLGESRIKIIYDFSQTSMPGLLVDAISRQGD